MKIATLLALFSTSTAFMVGPSNTRISLKLDATIEKKFEVNGKKVTVFKGKYDDAVVDVVVSTAKEAISKKGSFSLAIPGGSVVSALKDLQPTAFDMSKVHIYFCNERIGADKCYSGALDAFVTRCGIPLSQVHKVPVAGPVESAAKYEAMIRADHSLDQSGPIPSVDLMLLGTGDDGHCGSLYPQSAEIKATGQGKVVLPIDEGDKKSIAVSMDFMNASKKVVVSAAEAKRAPMVRRALTGDFPEWDCPSGLVNAKETHWFVDTDSIAEYKH
jgi:6-phosphogluconolactonase